MSLLTLLGGSGGPLSLARLRGFASVAASPVQEIMGSAGLSSDGEVVSFARRETKGASSLSSSVTVSTAALVTRGASASLSGSASVSASAELPGSPTVLSGEGTLSATGRRGVFAGVAFTASGTVTAQADREREAAASLSGSGTLAAAAARIRSAAASLSGSGTVTAEADVPATATPFDLGGATYDSISFDVSTNVNNPNGCQMVDNDTKIIIGTNSQTLEVYDITWDANGLNTVTHNKSYDVSGTASRVDGLCYNSDGTELYVLDGSDEVIEHYSVSPAWTGTLTHNGKINLGGGSWSGLVINGDDDTAYIGNNDGDEVVEYSITDITDRTTWSTTGNTLSSGQTLDGMKDLEISENNKNIYVSDNSDDNIRVIEMTTASDLSTGSLGAGTLDTSGQDGVPGAIAIKSTEDFLIMVGWQNDSLFQYS